MTVAAAQDINNLGGAIDGSNSVTLAAGRDINVNSTSVSTANAVTSGTNINQVASVSGKDITLAAGRIANLDLTLPNNALFRINAGPAQRFLVQTDPQFVGLAMSADFCAPI